MTSSALDAIPSGYLKRRLRRNVAWLSSCGCLAVLTFGICAVSVVEKGVMGAVIAAPFLLAVVVALTVVRAHNPVWFELVHQDGVAVLRWRRVGASVQEGRIVDANVSWTISHGVPPLPEKHLVVEVRGGESRRSQAFVLANAHTRSSAQILKAAAAELSSSGAATR